MAGGITEQVTYLDSQMYQNFQQYAQVVMDSWRDCLEDCNNGQIALITTYLMPAAYEHVGEAAYYWPRGATPGDYADKCYSCYDEEVIQRAFSKTIERAIPQMQELITEADGWQTEHEFLVAILGDSWEPHSVYPPFEGGNGWATQPTGDGAGFA